MNRNQIRSSYQRGITFAIIIIFLVMIAFNVMAATIISKLMGTPVARGVTPSVTSLIVLLSLIGLWNGSSASQKFDPPKVRITAGLIAGVACSILVVVFAFILYQLEITKTDPRYYLTALSLDNIRFFLLGAGPMAFVIHPVIYILSGVAGAALGVFFNSEGLKTRWSNFKQSVRSILEKIKERSPLFLWKYGKYILYLIAAIVVIILPVRWGSYWNYVFGTVGLYVIAGLGLNIIVGLSGQLVLGYAAFFAIGAYAVALLNSPFPHNVMMGFWTPLLIGVLAAVAGGILLGLPLMRLRGDYLAIVTLGFGEIIRILLKSDLLTDFTGGPRGIQDIKGPSLFGRSLTSDSDYMYLIIVAVILAIFLYNRLQNSRTGRAWLAINNDEIASRANGVNTQTYKLLALCLGAAFAGLAGGIFAARNQFTGPDDHSFMVSINVLSLVIVGGMNSVPGIILGSFTLKGLPEILREVETYRLLVFGALLVVMMIMRPEGLWPSSRPNLESKFVKKKEPDDGKEGGGNA